MKFKLCQGEGSVLVARARVYIIYYLIIIATELDSTSRQTSYDSILAKIVFTIDLHGCRG